MTTKSNPDNTKLLSELDKKIIHLQEQIKNNDEELLALNARKNIFIRAMAQAQFDKRIIQEKMFITQGIDSELVTMRKQITNLVYLAGRKDITVAEKESAEKEIPMLITALKAKCDHRFVLDYHGFDGSPINDYNDKYSGERLCLICILIDPEQRSGKDTYEILTRTKSRLIKRDLREREKKERYKTMWIPLPDILAMFTNNVKEDYVK